MFDTRIPLLYNFLLNIYLQIPFTANNKQLAFRYFFCNFVPIILKLNKGVYLIKIIDQDSSITTFKVHIKYGSIFLLSSCIIVSKSSRLSLDKRTIDTKGRGIIALERVVDVSGE